MTSAAAALPVDAGETQPVLRAASSFISSNPSIRYFFAFDPVKFYRNVDAEMKALKAAGFNTLYVLYNPYRSEDGRPTPWQDDIPLNDPDFKGVAAPTAAQLEAEDRMFANILAACRKSGMKAMFNAACWTPQKWLRENPSAISRFPDGSPQYDEIFERFGCSIFTPCFRSTRFFEYTERTLRGWVARYAKSADFQAVLLRARVSDRYEIRLDDAGFPVFYIHQDTIDRNWCHCAVCQSAFRKELLARYGSLERLNRELGTSFGAPEQIAIPLSPNVRKPERFTATALHDDPTKQRLWYEAAEFWSRSIEGWRERIVATVRAQLPSAEVLMISKYPLGAFLTDYPLIARKGKLFLMDSYPMESELNWSLLRYFFDIEVYQSAAEQQGQALFAHVQAYHNKLRNRPSRAPSEEEYRQQHVGLIARRVGAQMTFVFDHAAQIGDAKQREEDRADSMAVVSAWHQKLPKIEEEFRGAVPYMRGVIVRYNPLANCNPKGALAAFRRYRYWKERGVPVRVQWDEKSAAETVPESFEFQLDGAGPHRVDLVVCECAGGYRVVLTNLMATEQTVKLRVRLTGQAMERWKARPIHGPAIDVKSDGNALLCAATLGPFAATVFSLVSGA